MENKVQTLSEKEILAIKENLQKQSTINVVITAMTVHYFYIHPPTEEAVLDINLVCSRCVLVLAKYGIMIDMVYIINYLLSVGSFKMEFLENTPKLLRVSSIPSQLALIREGL